MSLKRLMRARIIIMSTLVVLLLTGVPSQRAAVSAQKAKEPKLSRAEEIVERAIFGYFPSSGRAGIYAIQRNGILRGLVTLIGPEGKREGKTITKFIRKPLLTEDLLMIEVELADLKYTIGFDGKQTWTSFNGQTQLATPDIATPFHASHAHNYEALLRYKENNCKLEYVSTKDFTVTSKIDVVDMVTPEGERTRYEINQRTGHILYLEYETKTSAEAPPNKYRLVFSTFKVFQNTIVPSKTLVYENGRQIEERVLVEAAFNVQLDDKAFKAEVKATDAAIKD